MVAVTPLLPILGHFLLVVGHSSVFNLDVFHCCADCGTAVRNSLHELQCHVPCCEGGSAGPVASWGWQRPFNFWVGGPTYRLYSSGMRPQSLFLLLGRGKLSLNNPFHKSWAVVCRSEIPFSCTPDGYFNDWLLFSTLGCGGGRVSGCLCLSL